MHDGGMVQAAGVCAICRKGLTDGALFCSGCGHPSAGFTNAEPASLENKQSRELFKLNWSELKQVGWFFGLLLLSSLVLGWVTRANRGPGPETIVGAVDAVVVLAFVVARWHDVFPLLRFPSLTTRRSIELGGFALVFVVAMGAYFALLERVGVPMVSLSKSYLAAGWPVWSMFALISVLPGIVEELAFRGVIQSSLGRVCGEHQAWIAQAALFSVLHLLPIAFPSHFIMGLCFGYMRLRSRSLYPAMALHASWNGLALCQELYFR
jgi:uncharacterized protein